MRVETRTKYGRRLVRVLVVSVEQPAMRRYLATHGRRVRGRTGWLSLTWKEWRNRPGVRSRTPAEEFAARRLASQQSA